MSSPPATAPATAPATPPTAPPPSTPTAAFRFTAEAYGWPFGELPLFWVLCHRAATALHRGVLLPRRTAER